MSFRALPSRWLRPTALALGLALGGVAVQAQDAVRVAYVDMQRLIDSAPQVIQGRARLAREFAEADASLRQEQIRLDQLESALREAPPGQDGEPSGLAVEAAALRRSIERSRQRLNEELSSRVQQETDSAWPRIEEAVAAYAREQGYDLVVPGPVLYASGRIDITDRVLDRLRAAASANPP